MQMAAAEGKTGWGSIPAIIEEAGTCDLDPGRKLSEHTVRRHDWTSDCVLFAELKANGRSHKQLEAEFGLSSAAIRSIIAVGECLTKIGLDAASMCQLADTLSRQDFIDHVVPLRTSTHGSQSQKGTKGFVGFSREDYGYIKVKECVRLILRDELSRTDLPAYSRTSSPQKWVPAPRTPDDQMSSPYGKDLVNTVFGCKK